MILAELREGLTGLEGVGRQSLASLAALGLQNCADLLQHYPVSYLNRQRSVPLHSASADGWVNTVVQVKQHQLLRLGQALVLKITVEDESGPGKLVCFNRRFLVRQLRPGCRYFLAGRFQRRYGELQSSQFDFENYSEQPQFFNRILPVYRLAGNLRQNQLRKWVEEVLRTRVFALEDELPAVMRQEQQLCDKQQAIWAIHFPKNEEELQQARQALGYQELFHLMLVVAHRRCQHRVLQRPQPQLSLEWQQRIIASLPFTLSAQQLRVLQEINRDLASCLPMQRLLHGEVGCGKTVVAILAALPVLERGAQVALLAPTEVLARQLYHNVRRILAPLNLTSAYLTAQLPPQEREGILQGVAQGKVALVVGTHALFSQRVDFISLGLVIIDEQHRFGVEQRLAMRNKGQWVDLLLMSATPIPRTLALTLYSDLALSSIHQLPAQRRPIVTYLAERGSMERVYRFVESELCQGRQAYFVCPLVQDKRQHPDQRQHQYMGQDPDQPQDSDMGPEEIEPRSEGRSVEAKLALLQRRFPSFRVGAIHGQMKLADRQRVMDEFTQQRLHVLVASTVIEVGVDVANATVMVVEDAPSFGLAQLHQLRGRVGRGAQQSYCFLLYSQDLSSEAKERLKVLKQSNDGFAIAEQDFSLRGPGDLLGTRQSGYPALRLADLRRDWSLLRQVRRQVFDLLQQDPGLLTAQHGALRRAYAQELGDDEERLLESG